MSDLEKLGIRSTFRCQHFSAGKITNGNRLFSDATQEQCRQVACGGLGMKDYIFVAKIMSCFPPLKITLRNVAHRDLHNLALHIRLLSAKKAFSITISYWFARSTIEYHAETCPWNKSRSSALPTATLQHFLKVILDITKFPFLCRRWRFLQLHSPWACWCCWPDYPMEFPAADASMEIRTSSLLWKHCGYETCRADTFNGSLCCKPYQRGIAIFSSTLLQFLQTFILGLTSVMSLCSGNHLNHLLQLVILPKNWPYL